MNNQNEFLMTLHTPIYNLLNEMAQRITEANADVNEATLNQMKRDFQSIVYFLQERQFNPTKQIPQDLQFFIPEVDDIVTMLTNRDQQIQERIQAMPAGDPRANEFQSKVRNQKDNFEMRLNDIARNIGGPINSNNNLAGGKRKHKRKSRKAKRKSRKANRKARKTRSR